MAYYVGQTTTGHAITADRIVREVDQSLILEPDADIAPFLWLSRQGKKVTKNPKFESMYYEAALRKDQVHGAHASDATEIVVHNAGVWRIYDTFVNARTLESVFVTDVNRSTNTLTVIRGIGTTAAAMTDNDYLYITGSASPEGDTRLTAVGKQPTFDYNYTEIFRHTVEVSRTQLNTDEYGPNDLAEEKQRKWDLMQLEIEAHFLFGGRHLINSGGDIIRFTQGIIPALGTGDHVKDEGGTLSLKEFDTWAAPRFTYGTNRGTKICLCNMKFLQVMNLLAADYMQINMDPEMKKWGWSFTDYRAYYGMCRFQEHRLLTRMFSTTGVCLMVDPPYIRCRPLQNSDLQWFLATKDSMLKDGVVGEWLGEIGLEVKTDPLNPSQSPHGWLYGVTDAA